MNANLTYLVAQEHINDLLREARREQRSAALRRTRRLTLASTRLRLRRRVIAGIVVGVCGLFVAVPAAGAADFTWSGATTDHRWSSGADWVGGMAPSGSVATLAFPTLTSPACTSMPPADACYSSVNDISGLTANALSIDSSGAYTIQGDGITLGAGGLSASVPGPGGATFFLDFPIALGAAQSWTIGGGSTGAGVELGQAVSGTADALTAHLAHTSGLDFAGDTEVGTFNAVGSDSTQTGRNALSNGTIYVGKKLNGTDGNAVDLTDIALNVSANASVGPLTSTGGEIELASAGSTSSGTGTILTVNGGATFDSNSFTGIQIEGPGTTAGTDYSQLSASGAVSLNGGLALFDFGTSSCPNLHVGDVDTLITTTGALTGTFTGFPDGTVLAPCGTSGPTLRINYTAHSVTATVVTAGAPSSSLALMTSPANPVTNQPVTLTATITAASGSPSGGTVEFDDNEGPIAGCGTQPVSWNGTTGTSTCQTSFAAASSPEFAFATFTPTNASVQGSGNGPIQVSIGQDPTGTAVAASNASPTTGQSVTYTATVTPADSGPTEPSGTVQFLDGAAAIAGCASQPLTAGAASSTATCTVDYGTAGAHSVTATYSGDTNFTGSTSPAQSVNVQPSPPVKPSNTAPPVASGAPTVGQTDTVTTGTWSGTGPITYSYQWRRCNPGCVDIAGATGSSYTPAAADVGADILALVTATNSDGSAQASSNMIGPVAPSVPQILAALASVLSPHGKGAMIGALLKTGGFTVAFTAPGAGTLAITWYFLPKAAHLTKATKAKPVTVASARVSFAMAGTTRVKVQLTRKGKLLLMAARKLQLVSHVGYTPTAGNPTVKTNRFTLGR